MIYEITIDKKVIKDEIVYLIITPCHCYVILADLQ